MATSKEDAPGYARAGGEGEGNSSHPVAIGNAVLLAGVVVAVVVSPEVRGFFVEAWRVLSSGDEARIGEWVGEFGWWAPLVIVVLMVVQMFLVVVPSWMLMVVAILAYGPWWGTLIAVAAVAAASSVGYAVGTLIGEHGLERIMSEKSIRRIERETARYGLWAVAVARLNPLLSNDAISFIGGVLRLGYIKFLAATLAGILPLTVAIAVFGSDWEEMKSGLIVLSVVSLAGLVAKIVVDRRRDASADGA